MIGRNRLVALCGVALLLTALWLVISMAGCDAGSPMTTADDGGMPAPAIDPLCRVPHLPARLRRLSRFEYDNTVRDLLHVESSWGRSLPPDDEVEGFDNNTAALHVGPLWASKLLDAAEGLAEAALVNLPSLAGCAEESDACAAQLVSRLGRRAFRRPLTGEEQQRYLAIHRAVVPLDGFREGARTIIATLLQSPHFLYRPELGSTPPGGAGGTTSLATTLTDHEIASQLSYLLWSSMPDEALLAAADAGTLHTPEQIEVAARRLLGSARSRPMLEHFAASWLELDGVLTVPKLGSAAAALTPALRQAMLAEPLATFDDAVRSGARLPSLLTGTRSILTDELARFYGVAGDPLERLLDGSGRWDLSGVHRGGVLSSAALLTAHAGADFASPVMRGKLVRERLLCEPLLPPPVGLVVTLPPVGVGQSNRARFAQHMADPYCASCHQRMDPIGFGFERFDAIGRYIERDAGGPIDDRGQILESHGSDGSFRGVRELEAHLAASAEVADCFASQWVRSGYGVTESPDVACLLSTARQGLRDGDLRIDELLVALTQSIEFRQRVVK